MCYQQGNDGYVKVYVDGCCTNNGRDDPKAGYGVFFTDGSKHNISAPVHGPATNNNAEIQAVTAAFRVARHMGFDKMRIYTDSEFVINAMTEWISKWKSNGWRTAQGKKVKNLYSFKECDKARHLWGGKVKYKYVCGHSGNYGNDQADRLAKKGARRYES